MKNDFVIGMEILINCKHLVEEVIEEKKYILRQLETRGDLKQARKIQAQIDRYQRALNGEPLHRLSLEVPNE